MCGGLNVWFATCVVGYICGQLHVWLSNALVTQVSGDLLIAVSIFKLGPKLQNSLDITCGRSLVGGSSTQQEGWTQYKGNMMVLLILTNCSHRTKGT